MVLLTIGLLLGCAIPTGGGSNGGGDTTPPADPTGLSTDSGNTEMTLTWNDPADSDLQGVEISWTPVDGESQPKSVGVGVESATVTGLTNGTDYTFSVQATDNAGNLSDGVSATAPPADVDTLFVDMVASIAVTEFEDGAIGASSSFGDIDDDGDLDMLLSRRLNGVPDSALYINDGSGGFTKDTSASLIDVRLGSSSFGDIDGDDDLDLVITGRDGNNDAATALYVNDGAGNFTEDTAATLSDLEWGSSNFMDIDDDGDLDLLLTGFDDSTRLAILYTNDGSGTFSDSSAGLTGVWRSSSSYGDVDGDGDLDLVITGGDGSNLITGLQATLYTNDGSGNFTDASAGLTPLYDGSSNFGDVDGDGDLDLVITGDSSPRTAKLYINDGSGGFTEDTSAGFNGVEKSASSLGDVDNDGDLDLVISGEAGGGFGSTRLYINDGTGSFTFASDGSNELSGKNEYPSVRFGDIDGDGDNDLLVAGAPNASPTDGVKLYENTLY
jgi:hypothetical protein